jgi:hypothetical protein
MPFSAALSTHPIPALAVGEVVGQLLENGGTGPDVLFLFADVSLTGAFDDVLVAIHELLRPVVLVGGTSSWVFANEHAYDDGTAIAALAGYGFDAIAARTIDELEGRAPALTLPEPADGRLLLGHDLFDDGVVHVAFDRLAVEHVRVREAADVRFKDLRTALIFAPRRQRYSAELRDRLGGAVVGMGTSGRVGPEALPTAVLLREATITGASEGPG